MNYFYFRVQHPPCKWAQRADTVIITINVEDIEKEQQIEIDDSRLFFHCKGGHEHLVYELDFKFYKEVDSKVSILLIKEVFEIHSSFFRYFNSKE